MMIRDGRGDATRRDAAACARIRNYSNRTTRPSCDHSRIAPFSNDQLIFDLIERLICHRIPVNEPSSYRRLVSFLATINGVVRSPSYNRVSFFFFFRQHARRRKSETAIAYHEVTTLIRARSDVSDGLIMLVARARARPPFPSSPRESSL